MRFPRLSLLTPLAICLSLYTPASAGSSGNNGNHYGKNGSVKVSISPTSSILQLGQSLQFVASVSGTNNTTVNWLVNGTPGGNSTTGVISASGLYTAPTVVPSATITITAQSVVQSSASASTQVSFNTAPVTAAVSVTVLPSNAALQVGHSQQFSATVSGTSYTAVNWMVNNVVGGNSTVGTVTSSGMYTAPGSVPSSAITVTAQSAAQNTASATATVSITPATVSVSISPTNVSLQVGQSQQFAAAVSGASSYGITWLVSGIVGGNSSSGTITSAGVYTAPAAAPSSSVVVTAQSTASPSSSASASVNIAQPVSHSVSLSWATSSSSIAGYNVYRGTQVSGPFTKINPSLETATVYTDSSVSSGQTYYYATTAVNSSGVESGYSNVAQAAIP